MAINKIKVNQSIVSGYIPKDAFINESKTFLQFSLGYDKSYRGQDGKWVNQTAWIPVKLWAKEDRINRLAEKVKAGSYAVVTGVMDQSSYPDKNGNRINDVFLRADSIQVYDESSGSANNNNAASNKNTASYENDPGFVPDSDDGNLNFDFLNADGT